MWPFSKKPKTSGLNEVERVLKRSTRRVQWFADDINKIVEDMEERMRWNLDIFLREHLSRFREDIDKLKTEHRKLNVWVGDVVHEVGDALNLPLEKGQKVRLLAIKSKLLAKYKDLKTLQWEGRVRVALDKIETLRGARPVTGTVTKWQNEADRFAALWGPVRQVLGDFRAYVNDLKEWSTSSIALVEEIKESLPQENRE